MPGSRVRVPPFPPKSKHIDVYRAAHSMCGFLCATFTRQRHAGRARGSQGARVLVTFMPRRMVVRGSTLKFCP